MHCTSLPDCRYLPRCHYLCHTALRRTADLTHNHIYLVGYLDTDDR